MSEAVGNPLRDALETIVKLRGFPIALWTADTHDEYTAAFRVFWAINPTQEQFMNVMRTSPITSGVVQVMFYER